MKRMYVVTGAYGHLGNNIVRLLLERGDTVRGLALPGEKPVDFASGRFTAYEGDVREIESVRPIFARPEGCELIVIHTAGIITISSEEDPAVWDVNVRGTENMLRLCEEENAKRLVYVSSVHAIAEGEEIIRESDSFRSEDVTGYYAKTKAEATRRVLEAARAGVVDAVVVHPSGILGPNDPGCGHITKLLEDYLDGRLPACVKGGYDLVDVRDVAIGVLQAADRGERAGCYILSNMYCEIRDLLKAVGKIAGRVRRVPMLPMWLAKLFAPLFEKWSKLRRKKPLYTRYSLRTLLSGGHFSHIKATETLGYAPRSLEKTLRDTIDWLAKAGRVRPLRARMARG